VSNRRTQLLIVLATLVALAGVAALAIPGSPVHRSPTLGLDLQGGIEVVLQAQPPKGYTLQPSDLDRSENIIRSRIDKLGVSEPEVRKQGNNQIAVQLAGVFNQQRAVSIIGSTAALELYKLEDDLVSPSVNPLGQQAIAHTSLYELLSPVSSQAGDKGSGYYLFGPNKKLVAGPADSKKGLLSTDAAKCVTGEKKGFACRKIVASGGKAKKNAKATDGLPGGWTILGRPTKTKVITCSSESAVVCPGLNTSPVPGVTYYYLVRYTGNNPNETQKNPVPEMTGRDLKLSGTQQDFDPGTGEPIVLMQFTNKGKGLFHDITRDLAEEGQKRAALLPAGTDKSQAFGHFAIVLDDQIRSFPYIDYTQNPDGIPGDNGAQISGMAGLQEAKDLALVLQTGALPVKFKVADQTTVSATLGKDSLHEAVRAAIVGLLVVALFLILVYRFLGVVAVLGLGIYAALLYAVLLLFNVTLTLPGFAGLILTIGVAADANIVIFERIKEESRAGKSVRAAIAAGYQKGFSTIVDANVVTAITALVLFAVATAGVKGFALMLLIGTAISMLTAVAVTRAFLGILAGFRWFDSPRFMGASGQAHAKWLQIDYMGKKVLWFAISGTVVAICVLSLGIKGLNLGIDFEGGTQVTVAQLAKPATTDDFQQITSTIGQPAAVIQGRGPSTNGAYRAFQLQMKSLDAQKLEKLQTEIKNQYGDNISYGVKSVSASFGSQIARSAILAMFVSFLLIVLYITLRFQWKFALPVLVGIAHDVLICVGIYSLTGREVTTSTVAAVLTVLGYSMYDTIIVFDRIRENIPLMKRAPFAQIADVSIWETIRRSLATTFITVLPIISLLLFGGATLKDFAFALLVGVISGAYSTIFICTPLLTILKEREPEYARRKQAAPAVVSGVEAAEVLAAAEQAAAEAPAPEFAPTVMGAGDNGRRERRRQRRRTRPHGRAR
jgi:SecD/SecF fusion protein